MSPSCTVIMEFISATLSFTGEKKDRRLDVGGGHECSTLNLGFCGDPTGSLISIQGILLSGNQYERD